MRKMLGKKALVLFLAAVMVSLFALPALAAPAQVEVFQYEGSNSFNYYEPNLGKTFCIEFTFTEKYQVVTNDNGSSAKYTVRALGTATDLATGEVYRTSDCITQVTKSELDSSINQFTAYEKVMFVGAGPKDNLVITLKTTFKDGIVTKEIVKIEIR